MEFRRLLFGLVTARSSYIRLMRLVLEDLYFFSFYFNNVFVFTKTWEEHVKAVRAVLLRLREHGLTAKPKKYRIGFLHVISRDETRKKRLLVTWPNLLIKFGPYL